MFKNTYFRLALISSVATLALLVALPRLPIKVHNKYINLDTVIGGYRIAIGDKLIDFSRFKEGLDLQGGIKVVLKADMSKINEADKADAIEAAKEVISKRVDLLGVSEPYIATTKVNEDYRILVEIPGIDNINDAVNLIGQTAQLTFKQLKPEITWDSEKFVEVFMDPTAWEDTGVTGADLLGADVVIDQSSTLGQTGSPQIRLRFSNEGREKFSNVAKNNIEKPVALYLDNSQVPLSAPVVSADLATGLTEDPVISGNFDLDGAKNLSIQIKAGALPVPVEILEQKTIGATLGEESIQKSFFAGAVGLALVILFLIFKYGKLGILAGVALGIYTVVVLAIFKIIPVVLTLPGIAGFILSIGMATDANILVFERIKEEIFWGKPNNLAIKIGFERAWNSIKDSNISSLITAFVLFQLGAGPVKGFALTLAIGILVSLFSSVFVVKTILEAQNQYQLLERLDKKFPVTVKPSKRSIFNKPNIFNRFKLRKLKND